MAVENGQIVLAIDKQRKAVSLDDINQASPSMLLDKAPDTPTDAQLFAVLLPQAENIFVAPILRHESEPDAEASVAHDVGISSDELNQWRVLFRAMRDP